MSNSSWTDNTGHLLYWTILINPVFHSLHSMYLFTQVKDLSDFAKCPEGGCLKKCNAYLRCGHSCTGICHILDREHEEMKCKEKCVKTCPNDHPCPLECYKGCEPCKERVERILKCGHTVQMACSVNADTFKCYIEVCV